MILLRLISGLLFAGACMLISGCTDNGPMPSASDDTLRIQDNTFHQIFAQPFAIRIENTQNTLQGEHEYVDVSVTGGTEGMSGFDILLAYDATALSFQTATPGTIYDSCGWEYFTYRYGANGNCSGGCPSGLLRVVGIAETNNGANHPDCFLTATPFTLTTLDFLVTDNRAYECMYMPIRFFWLDCEDNSVTFHESSDLADPYSQTLAISRFVYDFEGGSSIARDDIWPTYFGAPRVCLAPPDAPIRFVDYFNGGVNILCPDTIDLRGDLNLSGIPYEIADAVLYSNYFVFGVGVFDNLEAQTFASDINADGIPLTISDLVYLIRKVTGDALPVPPSDSVSAQVIYEGSVISVNEDVGAAYVVVEGNVTPSLMISGVEMKYAYDAVENVTRVLVVGFEKDAAINGTFLDANGTIVSTEVATYDGAPVQSRLVPMTFMLYQNFPEPFTSTTTIGFAVDIQTTYTITIFNFLGQIIKVVHGNAEPGNISLIWDGSDYPPGLYCYRVEAGPYRGARMMTLVK